MDLVELCDLTRFTYEADNIISESTEREGTIGSIKLSEVKATDRSILY